jgi:hypothetical protein
LFATFGSFAIGRVNCRRLIPVIQASQAAAENK